MPYGHHDNPQRKVFKGNPMFIDLEGHRDIIIHQTTQSVPLPITTRSLGFSTIIFFNKLYNLLTDVPEYDIYAFYRSVLGLFEAKMAFIKTNYEHLRSYEAVYDFKRYLRYNYNWKTIVPIAKFLDSLGLMEYNGEKFCPIFTVNNYDSNEKLIPQPEHLTLSNLRETVAALSTGSTPAKFRRQFYANCPIPGTIWYGLTDDPVLVNGDQIMPPKYTDDDLDGDLEATSEVIRCALKLLPKYVAEVNLLDRKGSPSLFVSNNQDYLRIDCRRNETLPEYYKKCKLIGEIDDFWNVHGVSKMEQIDGCLTLPGELPISPGHAYPIYSIRDASVSAQRTSLTYSNVCEFL